MNVKTKTKKQFMYTTFSELVVFMYWTGQSMNNLLSYCGSVEVRINASDKDLPVHKLSEILPAFDYKTHWEMGW